MDDRSYLRAFDPTIMIRLLLLVLVFPWLAHVSMAQQELTIIHNATIYTVDDAQPTAEAIAFEWGRIVGVGSSDELLTAHPAGVRIDGEGATIIPGLIDAHAHLSGLGASLLQADLVGAGSVGEVVERLRAFEATLPHGAWLTGRGWDQNEWPVPEFPTAGDLDDAFPDRPVYLTRVDGHAAWVNSAAMTAVGGLAERPDPPGGRILRDDTGHPTGVLIDTAMRYVRDALPEPTREELRLALDLALAETARHGLTGIHDAGVTLDQLAVFIEAIDAGEFPIRNYAMIGGPGATFEHFCENGHLLDYGGRLTVRSIKLYVDGALGSRGAALLSDYSDDRGNAGLLIYEPEELALIVARAAECGLQVNTHAIGDRGVRVVLDVYEQHLRDRDGRHRVEHAQIISLDDLSRFADLGVIASMQPIHATSDMGWAEDRLGPARLAGAYAWRSLRDAGARLALGSDFPVEPVNPFLGIYAAITRADADGNPPGGWLPEQRLTREEALRGFTLDAAYAAFMEEEVGSLTPGKRADFVVLDRNIMEVSPQEVLQTRVRATYLDGEAVFVAD